jgi:hypothetical protein
VGGYSQLTALLASGLTVRLSCPVTAVRWPTAGPATVVSSCGTFVSRAVLVTVPLGVVRGALRLGGAWKGGEEHRLLAILRVAAQLGGVRP